MSIDDLSSLSLLYGYCSRILGCQIYRARQVSSWLEAIGEETDCKFFTKGPHDKWYPDCPRPAASAYNILLSKTSALFLEKGELELGGDLEASGSARPWAQPHNQIPVKLISNPSRTLVCAADYSYFLCTWGILSAASLLARDGGACPARPS